MIILLFLVKFVITQNVINYRGYNLRCSTATEYLSTNNIWAATRVAGPPVTYVCNANTATGIFNRCSGNIELLVLTDGTAAAINVCGCCYTDFNTFLDNNLPVVGDNVGDESLTMNLCVNAHADCYDSKDKCTGTALSDYYQKYCPLTCGICERTTPCVDLKTTCRLYIDYCEVDEYLPIMLYECPKTCGFCTRKATINTTAPCLDFTATCAERVHLCNIPSFHDAMASECSATCGYCEDTRPKLVTATIKSKSARIIVPNSQTIVKICKDERSDCDSLASLCDHPLHHSWVVQQCSLTCHYCDPDSTNNYVYLKKETTIDNNIEYNNYRNHNLLKISIKQD